MINLGTLKQTFKGDILPYFKDLWHEYIDKLAEYDVVAFTTYTSNIVTTDYIARYCKTERIQRFRYGMVDHTLGIADCSWIS